MQLSDFLTYVKYDLKRTDKDTEITRAYNDMLMWVALQMPHGGYKFQSYINTVEGTEDYPLPGNIIHLIHPIKILDGSASSDSGYPLEHISKAEYDRIEPNPNRTSPQKSKPWAYTIYSNSILLTGIPDKSTYLIEINWSRRVTFMSATTDMPSLGSEWDEVLKWGTLERVFAGLGQYDESAIWGSKYHMMIGVDDAPVGLCRKLFDIENDKEGFPIGQVCNNAL